MTGTGICAGRVAVVTGGGRGIGRAHALALAAEGARVVVNDLGGEIDGRGASAGPAGEVVDEILAMGGEAVANGDDISSFAGAERLIGDTLEEFGRIDVLINNAGILRDRMLVNMAETEWDDVIRVHLKGTFAPTRFAAAHWREEAKAGRAVDARVINTSSTSGIFGNPGQTNYGAAKAGIAAFTVILAQELGRYGVTVNAIAPGALTRMTANLGMADRAADLRPDQFDAYAPENISPLVTWLASGESRDITGRVFVVHGGTISVAEGWRRGPTASQDDRWSPAALGAVVPDLVARAESNSTMRS